MESKDILTPKDVAEELQINVRTVQKYLLSGELKASKLDRFWRIRREDLNAFLLNRQFDGGNQKPKERA